MPCRKRGISLPELEAELAKYRDVRFRAGITVTADGGTPMSCPTT